MTDDDKIRIEACFFQYIITDPYPEYSRWEQEQHMRGYLDKFFRVKEQNTKPDISIYKAWNDGFEFARNLVLKKMNSL